MKCIIVSFILVALISCNPNKEGEKKESITKIEADNSEGLETRCADYYKGVDDSIKVKYLDSVIVKNRNLPLENQIFIKALIQELKERQIGKDSKITIERTLFPIYKLKPKQAGVFGFSELLLPMVENMRLLVRDPSSRNEKKATNLIDSIYGKQKPMIYAYSFNKRFKTQIKDMYYLGGDCLEYVRYSFDTKHFPENTDILFGSKYPIELVYGNYPEIDSLIPRKLMQECMDCPSSAYLEKTFAKMAGTDNLFYIYADTFPLNTELDAPIRGLVIRVNSKLIYIWAEELDLFGCSCL